MTQLSQFFWQQSQGWHPINSGLHCVLAVPPHKGESLNRSSFSPSELEIIAPAQEILNLGALRQQSGHSFAQSWH